MKEIPIFNSLEELLQHLLNEVLKYEEDRMIRMSFDGSSILMFVTDQEIPIHIGYHTVYSIDLQSSEQQIMATLYAELLKTDLSAGWFGCLEQICKIIDKNANLFVGLLKGDK